MNKIEQLQQITDGRVSFAQSVDSICSYVNGEHVGTYPRALSAAAIAQQAYSDAAMCCPCIVHIFKNSATIKRGAGHRFKRAKKSLAVQLLKDARHIVISDYAAPNVLQSAAIGCN